jgi:acyl carrier protein
MSNPDLTNPHLTGTDLTETRAVVKEALAEVLNRDIPDLADDARLLGDLGLDSTSVIELLVALEDTLGVQFDPDQLTIDIFETFATLVGYVAACETAQERVS